MQYSMSPGTPSTGLRLTNESNLYVAVLPLVVYEAPTRFDTWGLPVPPTGQPLKSSAKAGAEPISATTVNRPISARSAPTADFGVPVCRPAAGLRSVRALERTDG